MTQIIAGHGEIVNTEETSQTPANEYDDDDCIPETTDDATDTTAPFVNTSATPTGHDDLSSSSYSRSTNIVQNRDG